MSAQHRARKCFGQHFLVDPGVIGEIVSAIAATDDDTLVEIGPGQGAITGPLVDTGAEFHAVEFDRDLVPRLREQFAGNERVEIHEADALQFDFTSIGDDLRVVGNLPYNISTPLLFRLGTFREQIRDMHFMLQKEVVDRITAEAGTKQYGRLTIMLGCQFEAMKLFDVPPDAFQPPPKVMSSIVALRPLPAERYDVADIEALSALVAQAFSKRRKTLRNALKGVASEEQLSAAGIDGALRPEQVPIDQWVSLSNQLHAAAQSG